MQDKLVALVTGVNKGIGLQIAKELAARGLTVLVAPATDLAAHEKNDTPPALLDPSLRRR